MDTFDSKLLSKLLLNKIAPNTIIRELNTNPLIGPGENYASILYSITVVFEETVTRKIRKLHLVAKTNQIDELSKKLFNTSIRFKQEIATYETIFPTLFEYQKRLSDVIPISFFPIYYGAYTDINPDSNQADTHTIILLENLKTSGYEIIDRTVGFDLESAKLILQKLAIMHGVTTAMKINMPKLFKERIIEQLCFLQETNSAFEDIVKLMIDGVLIPEKLMKECTCYLQKAVMALRNSAEYESSSMVPREPFATLIHCDFWINNIMLKFESNKVTNVKFIDFQQMNYGSPGNDIILFLYTSVKPEIVNEHFVDLIGCYYHSFIITLRTLQCDIDKFGYKAFLDEIRNSARDQFFSVLRMLLAITMPKGEAIDLSKIMNKNMDYIKNLPQKYFKRVSEVILEFVKNGWI